MNTKLSVFIGVIIAIILLGMGIQTLVLNANSIRPNKKIQLTDERCDADSLNTKLTYWDYKDLRIRNQLPAYCENQGQNVRYVGTPEKGGYWVKAEDYASRQKIWEQHKK